MHWCCDQSQASDSSFEEANLDQNLEEFKNFKPEKKCISDLDIREWNIELRENDLRLEEQNVIKKEITIERRSLEEKRGIEKAKYDLNLKEIEIERELRTLTERKQEDILTKKLIKKPIIMKMSFDLKEDIDISYSVFEKTERDENIKDIKDSSISLISRTANKKARFMPDQEKDFNEDENSGKGTLQEPKNAHLSGIKIPSGIALEQMERFGGARARGSWSSLCQSDSRGSQGDSGTEDHVWVSS